jgi:Fe-S-cluster containining protein
MSQFRPCGDCTACCSWLSAKIFGWEIGNGKSCKFLECNGCGVHKARPEVCRNYQCAWTQHLLPEEMRPDKCDVIVSVENDENGQHLKVFPINNKKINPEIKEYLKEWSVKMNSLVIFVE